MGSKKSGKSFISEDLKLNAALGFFGLLFLLLLFAFVTRVIYPRITAERADNNTHLISSVIQVEVLNGCGVAGVATRFTNILRRNGFDVVSSGNFDNFNVRKTMVIDRSGNFENARRVAAALGVSEQQIIQEISPAFYLDATVVIGSDFEQLNIP